jgi:hypothetical protein
MSPTWLRPSYWGIPLRSAIVSASVVMVAFALGGVAVAALLYRQLVADVDDAAARRVGDLIAGLQTDSAQDLDAALLTTDQRSPSLIVDTVREAWPAPILLADRPARAVTFYRLFTKLA